MRASAIQLLDRATAPGRWITVTGKAHFWDTPVDVGTRMDAMCGYMVPPRSEERLSETDDPRCGLCEAGWRRRMAFLNRA